MTMYSLEPIMDRDVTIDRPTCIYEMKNIHGDSNARQKLRIVSVVTGQFIDSIKPPAVEVATLEARQNEILQRLSELKGIVANLFDILRENNEIKSKIIGQPQIPVHRELILNVDPTKPCYSLFALQKLWKDVDFRISPFVHSSITSKVPEGFYKTKSIEKSNIINITLIWKSVLDTELILSGIHGCAILGESNFLSYIFRILQNGNSSVNDLEEMKMRRVLDLSYELSYQEFPKDKQKSIILLDELLGTNNWFSGKNYPFIADSAAWSSLKQSSLKKLPSNLSQWYQRCENTFLH